MNSLILARRLSHGSRAILAAILLAIALCGGAAAQSREYSTFDVDIFGGVQNFDILRSHPAHSFADGPFGGVRLTQNVSRYLSIEETFAFGLNNLVLNTVQPYPIRSVGAGVRNYQVSIGPAIHFTPRESTVRPYIRVAAGATWYDPTDEAAEMFRRPENRYLGVQRFNMKYGPAGFWGGGVKIQGRSVGLRLEFGGMLTQVPHFNLTSQVGSPGSVYIPRSGTEHALQASAAIIFRFRHRSDEPPPPPPVKETPPPPPPPPAPEIQLSAITGGRDVCTGDPLSLSVTASVVPTTLPLTYMWRLNDRDLGQNSPTISIPTTGLSGRQTVTVQVSAGGVTKSSSLAFSIRPSGPPTITLNGLPATINHGDQLPLSATATGSDCGGQPTVTYTVSEGSLTGSTFDSSGVSFDMANRTRRQTRVVKVTATAKDQLGAIATAQGEITVVLSPQARRLDDLVFPAGNARVNNCAKRVLLEELTPLLQEAPNSRVVLVGHRDAQERGRADLDRTRVLNAAAVISAGTGICPQLELSRVQGLSVGTDQSSTPRPGTCGTSTTTRERRGQAASDARAQFRRVEVWFVPEGAELPPALTGATPVPADTVRKLGCPK